MLAAYSLACGSWHWAQLTGLAGTSSSGCLAARSEWQLAQLLVLWTAERNLASSMNNHTAWLAALVLKSVLSEWQSRQALFLIGWAKVLKVANRAATATKSAALAAVSRPASRRDLPIMQHDASRQQD